MDLLIAIRTPPPTPNTAVPKKIPHPPHDTRYARPPPYMHSRSLYLIYIQFIVLMMRSHLPPHISNIY